MGTMGSELIVVLAAGAIVVGLILNGQRIMRQELNQRMDRIEARLAALENGQAKIEAGQKELQGRVARVMGLLEGLREAIAAKAT